ncbi:MAG TPA: class I SAM-dependent methyltransferase [Ignavibacteriales bacterium]|nr:class I SAM-dependent methyltransferase [Ignavibacteriales bacterium]HOL80724.1 class I SAM-dependent methyltransferase [Ignavibacteriales bacterium]HOM64411.1 class I SAM-dependent methyltransferase [Ignavibacteriales bacterium]HPD67199.1 class I SAM-dependent methyltransferase [Ignavibacteriales bacterium]HRR18737.1 class I SAM-dependent methyltransferase [Ignavibacteriales bacterium]
MSNNQKEIWKEHTKNITEETILKTLEKPSIFQVELNEVLKSYLKPNDYVIEIGCESGISSFLLPSDVKKFFLDFNFDILKKAKNVSKIINQENYFINADMFHLPFANNTFDIIFNAGVVEHFTVKERKKFLKEYTRVLKNDGTIIIAFPNHFSIPYKLAYIIYNLTRKWMFPKEFTIYNMKRELKENGLYIEKMFILSKGSIYNWLNFSPLLKKIMMSIGKVIPFQGYLRVLVVKKSIRT